MTDAFSTLGTIGVEEEFYAVDPDTLQPADASDTLLADPPDGLDLGTELFKFILETRSGKSWSVAEAKEQVVLKRRVLLDHARSHGYEVLVAGLHPAARWPDHTHIDKPRYRKQLDRIQYPQHRNITAGLHVHVGMDSADKAVWVSNEARTYLPFLLALSANSPFWYGRDTGLRSARAVVFENLPNTGIPTRFSDWRDYREFEERMVETDSISDRGEIWWDVRPNRKYGTVEVRSPDAQTDVERSQAFVELIHAVVTELAEQYDSDRGNTGVRREVLVENKWRALRYGHDAEFLGVDDPLLGSEDTLGLGEAVRGLAEAVDAGDAADTLLGESGATRQLEAYGRGGMDGVLECLRL